MSDDLKRLAADQQGVADLLGGAVAIGVIAGDLGADQDIGLADVVELEVPPAPFLRLEQALLEDGALQMQMLGKLHPLDHDRFGERAEPLVPLAGQQLGGRACEQVAPFDRRARSSRPPGPRSAFRGSCGDRRPCSRARH